MLEIENEKFVSERRVQREKIGNLEMDADRLNEKLVLLKVDFEEKNTREQANRERLKSQLRELGEELLVLKKQRKDILIQRLEKTPTLKAKGLSLFEPKCLKESKSMRSNLRAGNPMPPEPNGSGAEFVGNGKGKQLQNMTSISTVSSEKVKQSELVLPESKER